MEYCNILLILLHTNPYVFIWSLYLRVNIFTEHITFPSLDIAQNISEEQQAVCLAPFKDKWLNNWLCSFWKWTLLGKGGVLNFASQQRKLYIDKIFNNLGPQYWPTFHKTV